MDRNLAVLLAFFGIASIIIFNGFVLWGMSQMFEKIAALEDIVFNKGVYQILEERMKDGKR